MAVLNRRRSPGGGQITFVLGGILASFHGKGIPGAHPLIEGSLRCVIYTAVFIHRFRILSFSRKLQRLSIPVKFISSASSQGGWNGGFPIHHAWAERRRPQLRLQNHRHPIGILRPKIRGHRIRTHPRSRADVHSHLAKGVSTDGPMMVMTVNN
uniref:Uncharacterized protein n=1 Tax=viral metagenome TaxID=1070528 RepID=A0A2V0RAU6_9ZZZZ